MDSEHSDYLVGNSVHHEHEKGFQQAECIHCNTGNEPKKKGAEPRDSHMGSCIRQVD